MKILFLDDEKTRYDTLIKNTQLLNDDVDWVFTKKDFEFKILNSTYDVIMLDHDLQHFVDGKEWTGCDAAKFIDENSYNLNKPTIIVHSMNNIGASNIASCLTKFDTIIIPGFWCKCSYNKKTQQFQVKV